jgi:hypothetical protein
MLAEEKGRAQRGSDNDMIRDAGGSILYFGTTPSPMRARNALGERSRPAFLLQILHQVPGSILRIGFPSFFHRTVDIHHQFGVVKRDMASHKLAGTGTSTRRSC